MSVRVRFAWSIALVALSGCAVTVQGSPGSDAAVPGSDAAVPADAQASVDGATPPMRLDVPAGEDSTVFFPDAPLPHARRAAGGQRSAAVGILLRGHLARGGPGV
jgi:hypothetical protein